jgi:pseudouridine-5'-phosphate glycosidase
MQSNQAIDAELPLVALESTIISNGMRYPDKY